MSSIKLPQGYEPFLNLKNKENIDTQLLRYILEELLTKNLVNLRSLLRFYNHDFNPKTFYFITKKYNKKIVSHNCSMILLFQLLTLLYGSEINLLTALQRMNDLSSSKFIYDYNILSDLIELMEHKTHNFRGGSYGFEINEFDIHIDYELHNTSRSYFTEISSVRYRNTPKEIVTEFPFSKLLLQSYKEFLELNTL